MGMGFAPTWFR